MSEDRTNEPKPGRPIFWSTCSARIAAGESRPMAQRRRRRHKLRRWPNWRPSWCSRGQLGEAPPAPGTLVDREGAATRALEPGIPGRRDCNRSTRIKSRRSAPGSINSTPLTMAPRPAAPMPSPKELGRSIPARLRRSGMTIDASQGHTAPSRDGHARGPSILQSRRAGSARRCRRPCRYTGRIDEGAPARSVGPRILRCPRPAA